MVKAMGRIAAERQDTAIEPIRRGFELSGSPRVGPMPLRSFSKSSTRVYKTKRAHPGRLWGSEGVSAGVKLHRTTAVA